MYPINKKRIVWKEIKDQVVVMDLDNWSLYTFEHLAAFIWRRLVMRRNDHEILEDIISEYKVGRVQALKDFRFFIKTLKKRNFFLKASNPKR
ncbi:MAG: PqqD family protein [Deltaproteobacteria bacterium]